MASSEKPVVLFVALSNLGCCQLISFHLISTLQSSATLIQTQDATTAIFHMSKLTNPNLKAVILADGDLTRPGPFHVPLLAKTAAFVKNGGTVICASCFSNFVTSSELTSFFRKTWSLPWKSRGYQWNHFLLNDEGGHGLAAKGLPTICSQKALVLKDVAVSDQVYVPIRELMLQDFIWGPQPIREQDEAAVAFAKVGGGMLGYVGDVISKNDTTKVVMAMLGLK